MTGAQQHPTGWHRVGVAAFGLLGWALFAAGWFWAITADLPRQWVLLVLVPPLLVAGFVVYCLVWVGLSRRYTAGGERRIRPADEQPQTLHDGLGRPLVIDPACHSAAQVEIVLDGERKLMRVRSTDG